MYGIKDIVCCRIVSYGVVTEIGCVCTSVRASVCILVCLEPSIKNVFFSYNISLKLIIILSLSHGLRYDMI